MGTPTQRTSHSRTRSRRAHHALGKIQVRFDANGNPHLPHHATPLTGRYKNRPVTDVTKRVRRRTKKTSA